MYQNLVLMDYCHQLVDTYNSSSQQASRAANETEIIRFGIFAYIMRKLMVF